MQCQRLKKQSSIWELTNQLKLKGLVKISEFSFLLLNKKPLHLKKDLTIWERNGYYIFAICYYQAQTILIKKTQKQSSLKALPF